MENFEPISFQKWKIKNIIIRSVIINLMVLINAFLVMAFHNDIICEDFIFGMFSLLIFAYFSIPVYFSDNGLSYKNYSIKISKQIKILREEEALESKLKEEINKFNNHA